MKKLKVVVFLFLLLGVLGACGGKKDPSKELVVAVVDTGVDYTHPDLKDNMWVNTTDLPGKYGYDFMNDKEDPMDDFGHGSHCAGIILDQGKKFGVEKDIKIMAIKYLDENGSGDTSRGVKAYRYIIEAKKKGVNVVAINNSWGVEENDPALHEVMKEAGELGILSFNAAGNAGEDLDRQKSFPGGWGGQESIVVAASTPDGNLATFSDYGLRTVPVAAPGTDIVSADPEPSYVPEGKPLHTYIMKLKDSKDAYEENSEKVYTNVLELPVKEPTEENDFTGFSIREKVDPDTRGTFILEGYSEGMWMNLGGGVVEETNFPFTKVFSLPEKVTKLRFIVPEGKDGDVLTIGYYPPTKSNGKKVRRSGTSMATPMVVGEYLYLLEKFPGESLNTIRARILGGTVETPGLSGKVSYGLVDVKRALENPGPVGVPKDLSGDVLTISGHFFGKKKGKVQDDKSRNLEVLSWSEEEISFRVGEKSIHPVTFVVTTADGRVGKVHDILQKTSSDWETLARAPRALISPVAVAEGENLYYLGGSEGEEKPANRKVLQYRPSKDFWEEVGEVPGKIPDEVLSYGLTATEYRGNLLFLGFSEEESANVFFQYNPRKNQWKNLPLEGLPPTSHGTLATLGDRVFYVGGITKEGDQDNAIYEFQKGSWHRVSALQRERFQALVAPYKGGLVILGGYYGENKGQRGMEFFDGEKTILKEGPGFSGVAVGNALLFGGDTLHLITDGNTFPGRMDYSQGRWEERENRLGVAKREEATGAFLKGRVYFLGGYKDRLPTDEMNAMKF